MTTRSFRRKYGRWEFASSKVPGMKNSSREEFDFELAPERVQRAAARRTRGGRDQINSAPPGSIEFKSSKSA